LKNIIFEVIRKILELSIGDSTFDYKTFHALANAENLDLAFDNLTHLNVHVLDQILNVYNHQLKLLNPKTTNWDDLREEVLSLYEKDFYLGLIWNQDHYQVIAKYGYMFMLYDPDFDYPVRHTYRELLEYISENDVKFFYVNNCIDEEYHLDWYLEKPIYGGGRKRKVFNRKSVIYVCVRHQMNLLPRVQDLQKK